MAAPFPPVPDQCAVYWDNVAVVLRCLHADIPVMCAECFKTERNIIKLLRADNILREIDHAAFCHPYLVVVPVIPTGNQHTELFKGDCPDVIRLYPLPVQNNRFSPLYGKHFLLYHLPIKIPVFTKFYILQVASGREAHIGIAPSSL